jgi:hypothetical protein
MQLAAEFGFRPQACDPTPGDHVLQANQNRRLTSKPAPRDVTRLTGTNQQTGDVVIPGNRAIPIAFLALCR